MDGRQSLSSEYFRSPVFTPFLRRFTDERARDLSETVALYNDVARAHFASIWGHEKAIPHLSTLIAERVCEVIDHPVPKAVIEPLDSCQEELLRLETTIFSFPEIDFDHAVLSLKDGVDLRHFLHAKQ